VRNVDDYVDGVVSGLGAYRPEGGERRSVRFESEYAASLEEVWAAVTAVASRSLGLDTARS
jgi:hypothetical protein